VSLAEFRTLLDSGRKLKVKFGADVTAGFLHLGHAVNLWMMREMQERGHLVQFLIGDFTTRVGDPTGRSGARVPPSREAIERDAEAFIRQVGRVLVTDDPEVFEVRRNSEWWDRRSLSDFLGFAGSITAGKLLSRDMFRARMESGNEVRMDEMIYPVLQGQDSVELASDLTIVGSDQLFNESMGRLLQEKAGQKPQVIITTRITAGLDGVRKQSKTLGNFVAIDDGPREMFGKVMSLPDRLVRDWFEVYTLVPLGEIEALCGPRAASPGAQAGATGMTAQAAQAGQAADFDALCAPGGVEGGGTVDAFFLPPPLRDPRRAKVELARSIVERWHGKAAAAAEVGWFEATFSRREFPQDAPLVELSAGRLSALELLALALPGTSRSELRRLLAQGGASLDEAALAGFETPVILTPGSEHRLRIGKRRFARIRTKA
jgi:tyrosyl-tRNA synthetase